MNNKHHLSQALYTSQSLHPKSLSELKHLQAEIRLIEDVFMKQHPLCKVDSKNLLLDKTSPPSSSQSERINLEISFQSSLM